MRIEQFVLASALATGLASLREISPNAYCGAQISRFPGELVDFRFQAVSAKCESDHTCSVGLTKSAEGLKHLPICCEKKSLDSIEGFFNQMQAVIRESMRDYRESLVDEGGSSSPCAKFLAPFLGTAADYIGRTERQEFRCKLDHLKGYFLEGKLKSGLAAILEILLQVPSRNPPLNRPSRDLSSESVDSLFNGLKLTLRQRWRKWRKGSFECKDLVDREFQGSGIAYAADLHRCIQQAARGTAGPASIASSKAYGYIPTAIQRVLGILETSRTNQAAAGTEFPEAKVPAVLMYYITIASGGLLPPSPTSLTCDPVQKTLLPFLHRG